LIRSGAAIQAMRDLDVIVFDKTGTLTRGEPMVTDVVPVSGLEGDEDALLRWAAAVELGSEHPVGKAVVQRAREQALELGTLAEFQAIRGKGVHGAVRLDDGEGQRVWVGSRTLLREAGFSISAAEEQMSRLEGEGKTVMLVAVESRLLGLLAVADTLKADASAAIAELHSLGLETAMLTGDNRLTAEAIAEQAGIDRVLAEVLPEDKLDEIRRLQEGRSVAMVGDGINDAPALTQADVGIAIGTGTDVAIEAADITLVRGDLAGVIGAIKLSRVTYNKVVQGLFWAFFYNVFMVPLAVLGLMHPVLAEIAMAISSITVVTNANLLRRADIRPQYRSA
jgi:Cu+-exporting ATPase